MITYEQDANQSSIPVQSEAFCYDYLAFCKHALPHSVYLYKGVGIGFYFTELNHNSC